VGDELLHGETVDSNAAWLGRELSALGVEVRRRHTVGDHADDIRTALRRCLEEADLAIFTGGLGPTQDDLTRPAVADELGAPLHLDQGMLEALRERFRRRGYETLPRSNEGQARVPEGAVVLPNRRGTAPGLLLESAGGTLVVLLPGVPLEMKGLFSGELAPLLRERFGERLRPLRHRVIHTTGVSESALADAVEEALPRDRGPVSVAFLPDVTGVDLRLTVRGVLDEEEAKGHLDRVEGALSGVVGPWRFEAEESGDLVEPVSRALAARGWLLGAAESCTGGLLAKRMTDRPGSSAVFAGGIIAYGNRAKVELLGVDRAVLERDGAVSEEVARQMAVGAERALACSCGVGITGIAGPDGGTAEKPVGLVCYAASAGGRVEVRSTVFAGDRDGVRRRSAQAALALLLKLLGPGAEAGGT
jgi:nicotinamide-nucleotide amidase